MRARFPDCLLQRDAAALNAALRIFLRAVEQGLRATGQAQYSRPRGVEDENGRLTGAPQRKILSLVRRVRASRPQAGYFSTALVRKFCDDRHLARTCHHHIGRTDAA
jgi:hypothetical protein